MSIIPSSIDMFPSKKKIIRKRYDKNITGKSSLTVCCFTTIGKIIAVIPIIRPMFAIFDPTTFPRLTIEFPFRAALTDTNNSGDDVPSATIVSPMRSFDILNLDAIATLLLTKKSPPKNNSKNPAIRFNIIDVICSIISSYI